MPLYHNAAMVRELTPLLVASEISDAEINKFGNHFETRLNNLIGRRYKVPVLGSAIAIDSDSFRTGYKATGTVSTTQCNTTITGISTLFSTELFEDDVVRIGIYGEAFKIANVGGATTFTGNSAALNTKSTQTLYLIPQEIGMVCAYYTAEAVLMTHFSEQAFNQDTDLFQKQLEAFAKPVYDSLINGDLFFSGLTAQTTANNNARKVYINNSNDIRTMIDDADEILVGSDFID
tara:strand:- start:11525 stop:12226 length:702 start_codon:yes stop_codon:yes gene_type:complete